MPVRPSFPVAEAAGLMGENEELVAGRHPVEEAFVAGRPARRLLVVPHRRDALERIVLHATSLRIPIVEVEGGTLTSLAGFDGHQGVALVVAERRFASLEDILARAIERGEPPFILVLDSLEDPQNLGSLLRSAEAAGVHGVLFPTRRQAPLTPAAVKASAGAVEHLLLVPVDDLAGALADLHVRGVRVVGAEADAALTHREADLRGPVALVVGHEGQGLGSAVRRRCDLVVRIPMRGRIESLNAAVAGSILLFEASGQRGEAPPPPPPIARDEDADEDAPAESVPAAAADTAPEPAPEPAKPKRVRKAATRPRPSPSRPRAGTRAGEAEAGPEGRRPRRSPRPPPSRHPSRRPEPREAEAGPEGRRDGPTAAAGAADTPSRRPSRRSRSGPGRPPRRPRRSPRPPPTRHPSPTTRSCPAVPCPSRPLCAPGREGPARRALDPPHARAVSSPFARCTLRCVSVRLPT